MEKREKGAARGTLDKATEIRARGRAEIKRKSGNALCSTPGSDCW